MFEELRLIQSIPKSLALQARDGWNIANEVAAQASAQDVRKFQLLLKKFSLQGWQVHTAPVGGYNCTGHVFANRRTCILNGQDMTFEDHILALLAHDGYRKLPDTEAPYVGDIVLYWDSQPQTPLLWHVATICEMRSLAGSKMAMPYALSKWDSGSGECLHPVRHVPYDDKPVLEYWTDRVRQVL